MALAWGQLGDRPVLATGGDDGTVRLWDPEPGRRWRPLTGHTGGGLGLAWGQVGDRPVLATGGARQHGAAVGPGSRARSWRPLTGHTDAVWAVAWGQLGDRPVLATGGDDGTVRLWDPEQGQELRSLTGHTGAVQAVAWGQLGDRPVLATGGTRRHGAAVGSGAGPGAAPADRPHRHGRGGAWGQLGDRPVLATGGGDGTVRLWDLVIERVQGRLPGYRSDDPGDPDRLNRDVEAAALAEMITAQSARPPLAIGLFGDWGEGKTHFLRRIADQVDKLAAIARDDPDDRLTHSAVRQVQFNAWHYAETDLWASLVSELFSQIAAPAGPG